MKIIMKLVWGPLRRPANINKIKFFYSVLRLLILC